MTKSNREHKKFRTLDEKLRQLGIDTSQFGFYDQPAFLAQEERDPIFLENYARWVLSRPRDDAYDQHVRAVVPKLIRILAEAFKVDSLEGGCIGASSMLTPMLNRLGVWSFGMEGSTILEVPAHNLRHTLQIIDTLAFPGAALGHAWVVAPPFHIVDATLALQRWAGATIRSFIPESLAVEDGVTVITPTVDDMIGWEVQMIFASHSGGVFDPDLHHKRIPHLSRFNQDFHALATTKADLQLRYCPSAVRIADVPLEEIMSVGYRRSAMEIWRQAVEPAFRS